MDFQEDVVFVGRKNQAELNVIYGASLALCFVPYFEGFGIPILEGFKCETPVITSNVTSMPEVAGDAALLVDPFEVESIANAMIALTNDEKLRYKLIQKGKERLKLFSWEQSAEMMWKILNQAIHG